MFRRARYHVLLFLALAVACGVPPAVSVGRAQPSPPHEISLGAPFVLALGDAAAPSTDSAALHLSFDAVTADSRCPRGVACVWAGDAVVQLVVEGLSEPVLLHTNEGYETSARVGDYEIRLEALTPQPVEGTAIAPTDYRAELVVKQAG